MYREAWYADGHLDFFKVHVFYICTCTYAIYRVMIRTLCQCVFVSPCSSGNPWYQNGCMPPLSALTSHKVRHYYVYVYVCLIASSLVVMFSIIIVKVIMTSYSQLLLHHDDIILYYMMSYTRRSLPVPTVQRELPVATG